jgi:hypothetical protein
MPAAAQTQASLASPEVALGRPASLTIRRLVPEVQMVVTAEDGHGRPVRELRAEQIKILDNGVAAPLTSFEAAADLPLRAAVVVDGSASMSRGYAAERQAALGFLSDMRERGEQVFTISFAAQQEAVGAESVAGREPGGQTALYDALISAAGLLRSKAPARRVLLLMSDGEDNYSRATLVEAIAALQQAEIAVYSVSVHSARLEYPGDRVLRNIATATGGRVLPEQLPSRGRNFCGCAERAACPVCCRFSSHRSAGGEGVSRGEDTAGAARSAAAVAGGILRADS